MCLKQEIMFFCDHLLLHGAKCTQSQASVRVSVKQITKRNQKGRKAGKRKKDTNQAKKKTKTSKAREKNKEASKQKQKRQAKTKANKKQTNKQKNGKPKRKTKKQEGHCDKPQPERLRKFDRSLVDL